MIDKGFDFDFDGVRDLFIIIQENLLADDLVDKEALGLVSQLVLREERRTFGQCVLYGFEELIDPKALLRGDGEDLGFRQLVMPKRDEGLKGLLGREVNLIDYKEHACARGGHLLHFVKEVGIAVGGVRHIGDI